MSRSPDWNWPGARWWRCDLHLHTPASEDYKESSVTADAIAQRAVDAGLDVIAVTDHDSGAWVDQVAAAAGGQLHPLTVLPGVEVTTQDRIHLLLLGDGDRSGQHIGDLLSRIGIHPDEWGRSTARSSQTIEDILELASTEGWLCVAAHADAVPTEQNPCRGALMAALDDDRQRRMAILDSPQLVAAEVVGDDPETLAELRGVGRANRTRREPGLALLRFSDAHRLDRIGRKSTWIKMTRPDREGLALALSDGDRSVQEDVDGRDPNHVPSRAIERLTIRELKYAGRGTDLIVAFNPWLNVIIGGRGAGKSTLVNALRLALGRADEALPGDFERFNKVGIRDADGALTDKTWLAADYRRDGHVLRAAWSPDGSAPALQEEAADGSWGAVDGRVSQRAPARVVGQGELAGLAADPRQILALVDDTPEVDRRTWQREWDTEQARFLSLRARAREQRSRIPDRSQLVGELTDLSRAIAVLERDEHRETLRAYQRVRRQEAAFESWQHSIVASAAELRQAAQRAAIDDPPLTLFDRDDEPEIEVRDALERHAASLRTALAEAGRAVAGIEALAEIDFARAPPATWARHRDETLAAYASLSAELAGTGADPTRYGDLVSRRQSVEARLASISSIEGEAARLEAHAEEALRKLEALRAKLTSRRRSFLDSIADGERIVRFELVEAGERKAVAGELRELLLGDASGDSHQPDVKRCTDLVSAASDGLVGARALKREIRRLAAGGESDFGGWFRRRVTGLKPEALDRLDAWYPADRLDAEYRNAGGGWQSLSQGSAGQRNAAILAFLLSYGDDPLVIDQPENDLDNALITGPRRPAASRDPQASPAHHRHPQPEHRRQRRCRPGHIADFQPRSDRGAARSVGCRSRPSARRSARSSRAGELAFESRYARIGERHV